MSFSDRMEVMSFSHEISLFELCSSSLLSIPPIAGSKTTDQVYFALGLRKIHVLLPLRGTKKKKSRVTCSSARERSGLESGLHIYRYRNQI